MEKREELEAALAASWDLDTLAVYADHLQAEGDPRGELIALDLEIEAHGNSVELSKRRTSLLYAWLGSLVPVDNVHAPWVGDSLKFGFVENLVPSNLERALASPIGPYVRGVTLHDATPALETMLDVLARHDHRWLARMSIGTTGYANAHVDPDVARRAFAAMPRLQTLELVQRPALGPLSLATIERLVVHGHACFAALGDGAMFERVRELVITRLAEPVNYDEYGDENFVEEAPAPAEAELPEVAFPALRRLELADTDLDAAYKLVRSLDARAHVTELRIPRLRNAADRDELLALIRDMHALEVVEVAHGSHYDPPDLPNVRLRRAELLAWPMQERAHGQGLRISMPQSKYGETVTVIDAVYVMEQRFEAMSAPARAAWSQLWRCIAALAKQPVEFPARVLADAVEAVPELMQNGWRELREELSSRRPLAAGAMVKIERCSV